MRYKLSEIVIFRHAHAKSISETETGLDCNREISDRGIVEINDSVLKLISENFKPELIFCSPYKRAVQTAQKISELTGLELEKIILSNLLLPDAKLSETISMIKSIDKNSILVSHMPFVSEIVMNLTAKRILFLTAGWVRILIGNDKIEIISSNLIY